MICSLKYKRGCRCINPCTQIQDTLWNQHEWKNTKLKRIRKAAEQGEFDILLVFMYDRLGRNLNETPFIAEWFTKKGIHVWSVYEGEIIDGVDAERMLDYIRFWQTDEAQKL